MLWFFKFFRRKIQQKNWRFLLKTKLNYAKSNIITLVFEKNANFFAENCQKSQKIVIITSVPVYGKWTRICWWNFDEFELNLTNNIEGINRRSTSLTRRKTSWTDPCLSENFLPINSLILLTCFWYGEMTPMSFGKTYVNVFPSSRAKTVWPDEFCEKCQKCSTNFVTKSIQNFSRGKSNQNLGYFCHLKKLMINVTF
jgi:hypothetical protein